MSVAMLRRNIDKYLCDSKQLTNNYEIVETQDGGFIVTFEATSSIENVGRFFLDFRDTFPGTELMQPSQNRHNKSLLLVVPGGCPKENVFVSTETWSYVISGLVGSAALYVCRNLAFDVYRGHIVPFFTSNGSSEGGTT